MTITTGNGFLVSLDKTNYGNSVTVNANGNNIITSVYVKTNLNNPGEITGTLTASVGSQTASINLRAEAISLTGGTETSAI